MSVFEKLLTARPVNKTAARVVSSGVHYTPNTKGSGNDSENPIPTRPITINERSCNGFADLTGRRIGRLTVIGISKDHSPLRWVVRCDCGTYSIRKAKAIKNHENAQDRCDYCRHLAYLKCKEIWRRTGRDVDIKDL